MLLDLDLTGDWTEINPGNDPSNITCSPPSNGTIKCIGTNPSGLLLENHFLVNGFEVVKADNKDIVGTYDGIDTITFCISGNFYTIWRRAGMQ